MASSGYILVLCFEKDSSIRVASNRSGEIHSLIFPNIYENVEIALTGVQTMFKSPIKAMVFMFHTHPFKMQDVKQKCQKFCEKREYFPYFLSVVQLGIAGALNHMKILVPENELLVVFSIYDMTYHILSRKNGCYHVESTKIFSISGSKTHQDIEKVFKDIIDQIKPSKIFGIRTTPGKSEKAIFEVNLLEMMKEVLENYNVIICDKPIGEFYYYFAPAIELCLNAMGTKKNPYLPGPAFVNDFVIKKNCETLIEVDGWVSLPYEQSKIIKVTSSADKLTLNTPCGNLVETIDLKKYTYSEVKATMKINVNGFYDLSVELLKDETLEQTFDKTLNLSPKMQANIILSNNDFSISITENGKTKTLKDSNGQEKTPLYISFSEEKPIIGEDAKKMFKEKPLFVVYDLIKLCSITDQNMFNPNWTFELKRDPIGDGLIVNFETKEGKKGASPAFLMALIFRDCLNRIKKETGMKVSEAEIKLMEIKPKKETLETLKKAAELMKLKINFV